MPPEIDPSLRRNATFPQTQQAQHDRSEQAVYAAQRVVIPQVYRHSQGAYASQAAQAAEAQAHINAQAFRPQHLQHMHMSVNNQHMHNHMSGIPPPGWANMNSHYANRPATLKAPSFGLGGNANRPTAGCVGGPMVGQSQAMQLPRQDKSLFAPRQGVVLPYLQHNLNNMNGNTNTQQGQSATVVPSNSTQTHTQGQNKTQVNEKKRKSSGKEKKDKKVQIKFEDGVLELDVEQQGIKVERPLARPKKRPGPKPDSKAKDTGKAPRAAKAAAPQTQTQSASQSQSTKINPEPKKRRLSRSSTESLTQYDRLAYGHGLKVRSNDDKLDVKALLRPVNTEPELIAGLDMENISLQSALLTLDAGTANHARYVQRTTEDKKDGFLLDKLRQTSVLVDRLPSLQARFAVLFEGTWCAGVGELFRKMNEEFLSLDECGFEKETAVQIRNLTMKCAGEVYTALRKDRTVDSDLTFLGEGYDQEWQSADKKTVDEQRQNEFDELFAQMI